MRRVRVAELKARLSAHLRYVRRGGTITVLDRDTPIAKVLPYETPAEKLVIYPATGDRPFHKMRFGPPLQTDRDIVELLLEDRNSGR